MHLRGIKFGDYHTADDWHLIMHEKIVSPPVAKTTYVTVPGRDGDLDMTEDLSGIVNYQDRTAEYMFILADGTHEERTALIAEIIGVLNGRRLRIVDEDDYPGYYMIGRLSVTEVTNTNAYGTIRIEAVCQPWRYAEPSKTKTVTLTSEAQRVNLINDGYRILRPTIVVSDNVTIVHNSKTTTLSAGTYILASITLTPGANAILVSGSGTVTITYQEAIF